MYVCMYVCMYVGEDGAPSDKGHLLTSLPWAHRNLKHDANYGKKGRMTKNVSVLDLVVF